MPRKRTENTKTIKRAVHYTAELGERICNAIANSSRGIRYICKRNPDFPTPEAIRLWLSKNLYPEFTENYKLAKAEQAEFMADEIIDIVDELADTKKDKGKLNYKSGRNYVDAARLRVDARKWVAAKLKPKVYGDKPELFLDPSSPDETADSETIAERVTKILEIASKRKDISRE